MRIFEIKVKKEKKASLSACTTTKKGKKGRGFFANKILSTMIFIPHRFGSLLKCSKWLMGVKYGFIHIS